MHYPARLARGLAVATLSLLASLSMAEEFSGEVVGVSDGDTVNVLVRQGNRKESIRVRLYGIDSPETKQAFGDKAKQFTSDKVFRKDVRVVVMDTDRYGRKVGKVYFTEGRTEVYLNLEIVKAGFAWWYDYHARRDFDLRDAMNSAREAKRGLWVDRNPVAPWDWRRNNR